MTPPRIFLPEYLCVCRDEDCPIAPNLCHCGCGRKTTIAKLSSSRRGSVKGMPYKYVRGHARIHYKRTGIQHPDNFYVYMYLRSIASERGPAGSPYYVGKGCGPRAWVSDGRHIRRPANNAIKIIASDLSERDAFQIELLLIHLHGRIDLGTGILRNKTDGGEGSANVSPETRKKRADRQRERWADPRIRPILLRSVKGKNLGRSQTEETKATLRAYQSR